MQSRQIICHTLSLPSRLFALTAASTARAATRLPWRLSLPPQSLPAEWLPSAQLAHQLGEPLIQPFAGAEAARGTHVTLREDDPQETERLQKEELRREQKRQRIKQRR